MQVASASQISVVRGGTGSHVRIAGVHGRCGPTSFTRRHAVGRQSASLRTHAVVLAASATMQPDAVRTLLEGAYDELAQARSQIDFEQVSKEDSQRMAELSSTQSDFAWTYGEITFEGAMQLQQLLDVGPNDVLYDLGSGYGRLVLQAHLQWGVRRSVGVELSLERHDKAVEAMNRLQSSLDPARPVALINENLLVCDVSDATVVYCACTCWDTEFMEQVLALLEGGAPALKWLVSTEPLERKFRLTPAWLPLDRMERVSQTWAPEGYPLYIYRRA